MSLSLTDCMALCTRMQQLGGIPEAQLEALLKSDDPTFRAFCGRLRPLLEPSDALDAPINLESIGVKSYRRLAAELRGRGIRTYRDLADRLEWYEVARGSESKPHPCSIPGLGRKTARELRAYLLGRGWLDPARPSNF